MEQLASVAKRTKSPGCLACDPSSRWPQRSSRNASLASCAKVLAIFVWSLNASGCNSRASEPRLLAGLLPQLAREVRQRESNPPLALGGARGLAHAIKQRPATRQLLRRREHRSRLPTLLTSLRKRTRRRNSLARSLSLSGLRSPRTFRLPTWKRERLRFPGLDGPRSRRVFLFEVHRGALG
jgi:hypothetical protein